MEIFICVTGLILGKYKLTYLKLNELVEDFSVGYRAQHDKKVTEKPVVKKTDTTKKSIKVFKVADTDSEDPNGNQDVRDMDISEKKHSTDSI